jgi:hypothetical protein
MLAYLYIVVASVRKKETCVTVSVTCETHSVPVPRFDQWIGAGTDVIVRRISAQFTVGRSTLAPFHPTY